MTPDPNPYAPPGAEPTGATPSSRLRLFSGTAIATHTILFTPLAGVVMALVNHRRRGDAPAFRLTLLLYGTSAVLLLGLALFVTGRVPALRFVVMGSSIALARMLHGEHQPLFTQHVAAGGLKARWYLATLLALGGAFAVVVAIAVVSMALGVDEE